MGRQDNNVNVWKDRYHNARETRIHNHDKHEKMDRESEQLEKEWGEQCPYSQEIDSED